MRDSSSPRKEYRINCSAYTCEGDMGKSIKALGDLQYDLQFV